jgi:hypothetical protein
VIDLGEWTLEDPDGSISVHGGRVCWTKADRSAVRYIGSEAHVQDGFHHSFTVCIEEGHVEDELNRGLLRLWELRRDWENRIWIYARKNLGGWTVHFEQRHRGRDLWAFHGEESLIWGRRYTIKLDGNRDKYRLRVLDEETGALHNDTGEIRGVNQPFQWVWIASTLKSRRNNGNWSTGYIENLIM